MGDFPGTYRASVLSFSPAGLPPTPRERASWRSEEHTSELQSQSNLVCRLLLEKKKKRENIQEQLIVRTWRVYPLPRELPRARSHHANEQEVARVRRVAPAVNVVLTPQPRRACR